MESIARMAGVPASMLDFSMAQSGCSQEEITWVQHYRAHLNSDDAGGLILAGRNFKPHPLQRMQAIAAAFIRNFMDARLVPLLRLLPDDSGESEVDPRILLVPDFFRESTTGGAAMTNWQFQYINGILMDRFSQRRGTVLHVESMEGLRKAYGKGFSDFLVGNWKIIESE